ncbi:MAG TPA: class D sortase [Bryobacteraceae bacterium]|nr:class D sortase [Bryobacteraceae bacterium]
MKRILEGTFLLTGLILLDCYIWIQACAVLYQAHAVHEFRKELKKPAPPRRPLRDELLGMLEIPSVGIRAMVREGAGEATLAEAVGHVPSSPLPGSPGNVALAGHRDTFFRPLRHIRVNDRITFATLRGTYEYAVESTRIVRPSDVSVLDATAQPALTLVTCYPFYYVGDAPKRFIVRARQIGGPAPAPVTAARNVGTSSAVKSPPERYGALEAPGFVAVSQP